MNKIKYNLFQAAYDPNAEKMAKQDQQQGADADIKVTLCERCGFRGTEAQLGLGSYNSNEMKIRNKSLSSIKIPDGVKVTLFEQPSFKGRSIDFFTDNICLLDQDFLDKTSSLKITKYDERLFVSLYPECNFQGSEYQVGIGKYSVDQMGIPKNKLSALRIPPGLKVILYTGTNFNGRNLELNKDISCLINVGFDNQTSSIEVISDKDFGSLEPEPTAAKQFVKGFSYVFFSYVLPVIYLLAATAMGSLAANDAIGRSPGIRLVYFIYGSLFAPFMLIYYIIRAFKGSYPLWYNFLPLTTYVSENSLLRTLLIPFIYKQDANAVYKLKQFDEFAKTYVPDFKPLKLPEVVNVQPIMNEEPSKTTMTKPTSGNNNTGNNTVAKPTSGNNNAGNNTAAKPTSGNNTVAKPTSGNNTAGNNTVGNNTAGNNTAGNNNAGNNTAGNNTVSNNTTGNNTAGNNTAGNNTVSNNTTGNNTAGNNTAGNNTVGNNTTGNNTAGNNTTGNNTTGNNTTGNNTTGNNNTGNNTTGNNTTGNNNTGNNTTGNNTTGNNTTAKAQIIKSN